MCTSDLILDITFHLAPALVSIRIFTLFTCFLFSQCRPQFSRLSPCSTGSHQSRCLSTRRSWACHCWAFIHTVPRYQTEHCSLRVVTRKVQNTTEKKWPDLTPQLKGKTHIKGLKWGKRPKKNDRDFRSKPFLLKSENQKATLKRHFIMKNGPWCSLSAVHASLFLHKRRKETDSPQKESMFRGDLYLCNKHCRLQELCSNVAEILFSFCVSMGQKWRTGNIVFGKAPKSCRRTLQSSLVSSTFLSTVQNVAWFLFIFISHLFLDESNDRIHVFSQNIQPFPESVNLFQKIMKVPRRAVACDLWYFLMVFSARIYFLTGTIRKHLFLMSLTCSNRMGRTKGVALPNNASQEFCPYSIDTCFTIRSILSVTRPMVAFTCFTSALVASINLESTFASELQINKWESAKWKYSG